jgi:hypothetical protein
VVGHMILTVMIHVYVVFTDIYTVRTCMWVLHNDGAVQWPSLVEIYVVVMIGTVAVLISVYMIMCCI